MDITLSTIPNMLAAAQTAETPEHRGWLASVVTLFAGMMKAEATGDLVVDRFERTDGDGVTHTYTMVLEAKDERPLNPQDDPDTGPEADVRVYRVRIGQAAYWDVAAQRIRLVARQLESGLTERQIRAAARIDGNIIAALKEKEKARVAVEALIS